MRPGDTVLTGLEVAAGINQVKRQKELQSIMKGEVIITRSMSLQDKLRASGFNEVRPFFMIHRADHVKDLSSFGDLIDELDNVYLTIEGKRAPPKDPKSPKQGKRSRRHLYLFAKAMLACKVCCLITPASLTYGNRIDHPPKPVSKTSISLQALS